MRAIRRTYFYLVSFISILTVIWGITNLLRSIIDRQITGSQSSILSAGLAQVLVSAPIFLLHWFIVQKDAIRSEEEKNSFIRALFLYAVSFSLFIPAVQNFIALLNRLLLQSAGYNPHRAMFGGYQSLSDNLIAIAVNLIMVVYFTVLLRHDWATSTETNALIDIRRLYRYIWMLYSLGLTIIGVQKLVVFILAWEHTIGSSGREQLINALTLLMVGAPLWVYWWRTIQLSINATEEQHSNLRLIIVYILSIVGCIIFALNLGWIVYWLLRMVFGYTYSVPTLMTNLSSPLSYSLIFGVIWAYFGQILSKDILSEVDEVKQASMVRIYRYILAMVGLGGTIYGLVGTLGNIIDLTTKTSMTWLDTHKTLAGNIAVLFVGVGLWIYYWQKANHESNLNSVEGDHARRSLSRKIYLYIAVFGSVIGTMVATGFLIYTLLQSLFGVTSLRLLNESLNYSRLILIFALFLVYHLNSINRDNKTKLINLTEKHGSFPVLALFEENSDTGMDIKHAFERFAASIPITFIDPLMLDLKDYPKSSAILLSSDQLLMKNSKFIELLNAYPGKLIIVPTKSESVIWITSDIRKWDLYKGSANTVKALAEGSPIKPPTSNSTWLIISYIIAGLVGLQILIVLISLLVGGIN